MFAFIGNIGAGELMVILLIALIVVGPGKLPEVAKGLGKALNEFRNITSGVQKEFQAAIKVEDPPTQSVAPPSSPPPMFPDVQMPNMETKTETEEDGENETVANEKKSDTEPINW